MAWAASLGGAAIAHIGVALPHALAQPVGGFKGAPHGSSIATLMVKIVEKSILSNLQRFADIALILDPALQNLHPREQAECCAPLIQRLLDDINIGTRLAEPP